MRKKLGLALTLIMLIIMLFSGCNTLDKIKVKVGSKNEDFEFVKNGKVSKIVVQNIRDKGFRFTVTDENTIEEVYDILSKGKIVEEKSSLEPDYIFQIYQDGEEVISFNYIAGFDKEDFANFYSDDKMYLVSKRIDNDIMKNFWNIRKPKDFDVVYYSSIIETLNKYLQENEEDIDKSSKIAINIKNDITIQKFILSTEMEEFQQSLRRVSKNIEIIDTRDKSDFDAVINVETEGFSYSKYKAIITIENTKEKTQSKYYIDNKHQNLNWIFNIFNEKNKPENF